MARALPSILATQAAHTPPSITSAPSRPDRADASASASAPPLRVLHLIRNLGLGGAETNLLSLVGAFDPARVETHIGYAAGGEIEPRFRAAGARLFEFSRHNHRVKSWQTLAIVARLVRYVRRHRIDVVHTHNFSGHVWGLLAAKIARVKLVEHVHDFRYTPRDTLETRHGWLDQYRFVRHFRGRSDRVVVLTEAHRAFVVEHGYATAERVVLIPNGIRFDDDSTTGSQELPVEPHEPLTIVTAARMDPSKNIDLILRIAARVREAVPGATFVIAGSGTHLDAYRERSAALGLSGFVHFIGFHDDIEALLAGADVFLLPSWLELHSIAILEAMKARVPVVVSRDVGCNDAFIDDGLNGFLCDPTIEAPWIDALVALGDSAERRRTVGERGYQTARRLFDLRVTATRLQSLYGALRDTATA